MEKKTAMKTKKMRVGKRDFYNHDRFPPSLPPSAQLGEHLPFDQFKVARKREEQ